MTANSREKDILVRIGKRVLLVTGLSTICGVGLGVRDLRESPGCIPRHLVGHRHQILRFDAGPTDEAALYRASHFGDGYAGRGLHALGGVAEKKGRSQWLSSQGRENGVIGSYSLILGETGGAPQCFN